MSEKIILKKSPVAIAVSILFLVLGALLLFLPFEYAVFSGCVCLLFGLLYLLFSKKDRIYGKTSSKVSVKDVYFNPVYKKILLDALSSGDLSLLHDFSTTQNGSKMHLMLSRDRQYAAVQLFDYVPYTYVEATPLVEFEGEKAEAIGKYIADKLK